MADFTTSYIEGEPQSAIRPIEPTQDSSSLVTLGIFNDLAKTVGSLGENYIEQRKAKEAAELEAANNQTLANFSREQLKVIDAVETGEIRSSAEGRMRMRANLSRFLADNPNLQEEIVKAHGDITKVKGLGTAINEGTEQEQLQRKLEEDAAKAGFVTADDSAEQRELKTQAYFKMKQNEELLKQAQAQLNYKASKQSLLNSQQAYVTGGINQKSALLNLQNAQAANQAKIAIGGIAQAYTPKLQADFDRLLKMKENGEIDQKQYRMALDQAMLVVRQTVQGAGGAAGGDFVAAASRPIEDMYKNYLEYGDGAYDRKVLEDNNAIVIAKQTQAFLTDPDAARSVAVSNIYGNATVDGLVGVGTVAMKFLNQGGQLGADTHGNAPPVPVITAYNPDKQPLDSYLGLVVNAMDKTNNSSARNLEETKGEVNSNLNSVLKGINAYGKDMDDAKAFNSVIDFLSNTTTGKFITKQGGWTDTEAATKAKEVITQQYDQVLIPLIKKEWTNAKTGGEATITYVGRTEVPGKKNEKPASDLITPVFNGSGVSFQVNPGVTDSFTKNKAKELNKTVAPILNKMVRAQAHLNGTTDYKSVWQNTYEQEIFGVAVNDANAEQ